MTCRDTLASIVLFVIGFSIIWHLHQLDNQTLDQLNQLNEGRRSRPVTLPEGLTNTLKVAYTRDEVHI